MLFWFRFVYPNLSFIESGHSDLVMKKIRKNLVDNQISYVYEDICLETMWQLNAQDTWDFLFDKAGRWWNQDTEIDIVAFDSTGSDIIFGECKYWEGPVGVNVLQELEKKAQQVEWHKQNRKEHYILFSIHGFTDDLQALAQQRDDLLLCQ